MHSTCPYTVPKLHIYVRWVVSQLRSNSRDLAAQLCRILVRKLVVSRVGTEKAKGCEWPMSGNTHTREGRRPAFVSGGRCGSRILLPHRNAPISGFLRGICHCSACGWHGWSNPSKIPPIVFWEVHAQAQVFGRRREPQTDAVSAWMGGRAGRMKTISTVRCAEK